jgi:hypothetical protein
MHTFGRKPNRTAWCRLVLAVCCCLTPGCKLLDRPGTRPEPDAAAESSSEGERDWSDSLRRPGPKGGQLGINPAAREIERHLGYQR